MRIILKLLLSAAAWVLLVLVVAAGIELTLGVARRGLVQVFVLPVWTVMLVWIWRPRTRLGEHR